MDTRAEKIALFRYGLIAPLVLEVLPRGELTRRAEEIAARKYEIPYSERTSLSVDTLLDWALRYRRGGFAALAKQPRHDRGQSRALTPQLAELIERLKRENPHRTGATLLRELALVASCGELLNWANSQMFARVLIRCQDVRCRHSFRSFDRHRRPASTTGRSAFRRCRVGARQTSTLDSQSRPQACA